MIDRIERGIAETRYVQRRERDQHRHAPVGAEHAEPSAPQAEHEALRHDAARELHDLR